MAKLSGLKAAVRRLTLRGKPMTERKEQNITSDTEVSQANVVQTNVPQFDAPQVDLPEADVWHADAPHVDTPLEPSIQKGPHQQKQSPSQIQTKSSSQEKPSPPAPTRIVRVHFPNGETRQWNYGPKASGASLHRAVLGVLIPDTINYQLWIHAPKKRKLNKILKGKIVYGPNDSLKNDYLLPAEARVNCYYPTMDPSSVGCMRLRNERCGSLEEEDELVKMGGGFVQGTSANTESNTGSRGGGRFIESCPEPRLKPSMGSSREPREKPPAGSSRGKSSTGRSPRPLEKPYTDFDVLRWD
ncbi:hypothetical protein GQ53DRAFT_265868 [Thozetella sp. PMI_491]|nr:hypothetical protein GQ53DRAFT_265868 [Thozetella sp. PMI_491]